MSLPHYPQSNVNAELTVKAMRRIVKRCWCKYQHKVDPEKWARGLLKWRNTPRVNGRSPAQIVFGHPARDILPIHKRAFAPEWQKSIKEVNKGDQVHRDKTEEHYNKSALSLPVLNVDTRVVVQDHVTKNGT